MRHRLRREFELAVGRVAAGAPDAYAAMLHQHAIEIEPLSGPLLRGLIEIHRRCGRHAEAVAAYQRFRDLLASKSGAAPSADLQAIYRSPQQPGDPARTDTTGS